MNLRTRLRKDGIRCQPWVLMKGEIRLLPISAQALFCNEGIPWDILEMSLQQEGYLKEDEELWSVLREGDLKRVPLGQEQFVINDPTDQWGREDFECPSLHLL